LSGGHFEYQQHIIQDIADTLEEDLANKRKYNEEWDYIQNDYTDETFAEFELGLKFLKLAQLYTQRIDWLISGDDGEETFHKRLEEDLERLNESNIN
jgi:hypothetical protein